MNIVAIALGALVWFLIDIALLRRLVAQAPSQEARLKRSFLLSLNIALVLLITLVFFSLI